MKPHREIYLVSFVVVFVVILFAFILWALNQPNYREIEFACGVTAHGILDSLFSTEARVVGITVESVDDLRTCNKRFYLHRLEQGVDLTVVVPTDLKRIGFKNSSNEISSNGKSYSFLGYGEQNRLGQISVEFTDRKPVNFSASCHKIGECDFQLSFAYWSKFQLPISGKDLGEYLGEVVRAIDSWRL